MKVLWSLAATTFPPGLAFDIKFGEDISTVQVHRTKLQLSQNAASERC